MLLVRVVLIIIYSLNDLGDSTFNLILTIVVLLVLFLYSKQCGRVYKVWLVGLSEDLFVLNLGMLCIFTLYTKWIGGNQKAVVCTSISITFVAFIVILFYHTYKRIPRKFKEMLTSKIHKVRSKTCDSVDTSNECGSDQQSSVTQSTIELREPLIVST